MTEPQFVHMWVGPAQPPGEAIREAEATARIRSKDAPKRGNRQPRVQKGTALIRSDMRDFGVFRRLELQRRASKKEEDKLSDEQRARTFDIACGWRSHQIKTARYLYLGRFVGQEALHARLAVCVLAESTGSSMLARFVKNEDEPLAAAELEQLMREYRLHFKGWVLERHKQMSNLLPMFSSPPLPAPPPPL